MTSLIRSRCKSKSLGPALFFDAPKNNQGFFYYGTLKICVADGRIYILPQQPPQEGFAKEGRTKNPFGRLPYW